MISHTEATSSFTQQKTFRTRGADDGCLQKCPSGQVCKKATADRPCKSPLTCHSLWLSAELRGTHHGFTEASEKFWRGIRIIIDKLSILLKLGFAALKYRLVKRVLGAVLGSFRINDFRKPGMDDFRPSAEQFKRHDLTTQSAHCTQSKNPSLRHTRITISWGGSR